jgi:hypothetical protein
MSEGMSKKIEVATNIGILVLTLLGSYVLIRHYILGTKSPDQNQSVMARRAPVPGTRISLPGVDWAQSGRTMLFVLSTSCQFCKASMPFYKKLVDESKKIKDIRFVALLPQERDQALKYLTDMGIGIQEIQQSTPNAIGASAFPTLILVDKTGTIKKSWVGKLSPVQEAEVVHELNCINCG